MPHLMSLHQQGNHECCTWMMSMPMPVMTAPLSDCIDCIGTLAE